MGTLSNNSRGDTIVEVLIAIVILGVVLGAAYATSRASLITIRDAQEHSEALTVAQSQVEDLQSGVTPQSGTFCYFTPSGGSLKATGNLSNCHFGPVDNPGPRAKGRYQALITSSAGSPVTYTVTVTWASLSPHAPNDSVQLFYRPLSS